MKKMFFFFAAAALSFQAVAQPVNPGFEMADDLGLPAFWKQAVAIGIPLDSACLGFGMDSLFFLSPEAHWGEHALELRTGTYCGTVYACSVKPVKVDDEIDTTVYSGGPIPFLGPRAATCSFYYKLESLGGDVGEMELTFLSSEGVPVGYAHADLSHAGDWTKATVPVEYYEDQVTMAMAMKFKIANAEVLHYGTRFLVDDISFEAETTGINTPGQTKSPQSLTCYPVPAANELYIRTGQNMNAAQATIMVTDASGRMVKQLSAVANKNNTMRIPVGDLAGGLYFVNVYADGLHARGKFVK